MKDGIQSFSACIVSYFYPVTYCLHSASVKWLDLFIICSLKCNWAVYFKSISDNQNILHQSYNKTKAFTFMPCLRMFMLQVIYDHVEYLSFQKVHKILCRIGMRFWLQTDFFRYNNRDVTFSNIIASDSNKSSRLHKTGFTFANTRWKLLVVLH